MTTDLKVRVFHAGLAAYYSFGTYYFLCRMNPPPELIAMLAEAGLAQLNPFKFLTFWDMLIQSMYFSLAFYCDIYDRSTTAKKSRIQQTRDYLFTTIAFTCAAVVTICFWALYAIDRNLIFPESLDSWFPSWVNHNIHTAPLFGVLLEMWLVPHTHPTRNKGLSTVCIFGASYLGFLLWTTWSSGMWTYPVLAMLPLWSKIAFLIGAYSMVCCFYIFGENLNKAIWGKGILSDADDGSQKSSPITNMTWTLDYIFSFIKKMYNFIFSRKGLKFMIVYLAGVITSILVVGLDTIDHEKLGSRQSFMSQGIVEVKKKFIASGMGVSEN